MKSCDMKSITKKDISLIPRGFDIIGEDDLKQLMINVFLKSGVRIYHEDIEKITIKYNPKNKEENGR